jgi:hypothetical protein
MDVGLTVDDRAPPMALRKMANLAEAPPATVGRVYRSAVSLNSPSYMA